MAKIPSTPQTATPASREEMRALALPEVKALVKKHGRLIIVWCLNQMREYEKKLERLETVKQELEALEKEIN